MNEPSNFVTGTVNGCTKPTDPNYNLDYPPYELIFAAILIVSLYSFKETFMNLNFLFYVYILAMCQVLPVDN